MSSIFQVNGIYYYKGFNQRFSLKTRDKAEALELKKQIDRKLRFSEFVGEWKIPVQFGHGYCLMRALIPVSFRTFLYIKPE